MIRALQKKTINSCATPPKIFTLTSNKENAKLNSVTPFFPYQIGKHKKRKKDKCLSGKWSPFSKTLFFHPAISFLEIYPDE